MYTGFAILNHDDKSYFIYNELPEDLMVTPNKMKAINSSKMDDTVPIYKVVDNGKVVRKILIDKTLHSGIDAVIPGAYLKSQDENEIYVL